MRDERPLWQRYRDLLRRRHGDDADDELRFHLDMRIDEARHAGLSDADAHAAALDRFGDYDAVRASVVAIDRAHDARRDRRAWADSLWQDLLFALRLVRRSPAFTAIAVLTLGLGIGANAAVYSVIASVLVRPLPFPQPSHLVAVLDARAASPQRLEFTSLERFTQWSRRTSAFSSLAALHGCAYTMTTPAGPRRLTATCVSPDFFRLLGVRLLLGDGFAPDADRPENGRVLVLGYRFWREAFGGDQGVIGRTIPQIGGRPAYTIVGVLPADFTFAGLEPSVWAPLENNPASPYREQREWLVFGRLASAATLVSAQNELALVGADLVREHPNDEGWITRVVPLQSYYADRDHTQLSLLVLMSAVGLLLLIACANVANLILARLNARSAELALRRAIGASHARILQQLMTECLLIGAMGGVAGFLIATATFGGLVRMAPALPTFRTDALTIDAGVLGFCMLVALVTSVALALIAGGRDPGDRSAETLRVGARAFSGRREGRMQRALVTAEMALAMVLLAGAGVLLQSFRKLIDDDPGFATRNVITFTACCLDERRYPTQDAVAAFHRQVMEQLRALPNVANATDMSGNTAIPLGVQAGGAGAPIQVRGVDNARAADAPTADVVFVEGGYFSTLSIALLRGHSFSEADGPLGTPVTVINAALARRLWPGENPIGKWIRPARGDGAASWHEVVGVAADVKQRGLGTDVVPTIYLSAYQEPVRYIAFVVHTRGDPYAALDALRRAVWTVDRELPLDDPMTLDQALGARLTQARFTARLLGTFAALALLLACIGLYGVAAYSVATRRREMQIRMALGAMRRDIVRLVMREGLALSAVGLAIGIPGALVLNLTLARLLYRVSPLSPVVLGAVAALLVVVTLVACYVPARRAAAADPAVALR